jgi:LacI family transcriptional regulator
MTASIKDVAKIAGVSTATVSHTINNTRFVSEDIRKKVIAAMAQLGYHPNLVARSLRRQKSKTIGLMIPDISNFVYTSVAEGVEGKLRESGYHVILSNSHDKLGVEIEMIKVYNSLLLDGLIMIPALGEHSYLHKSLSGNYPVVFVDRKPRGFEGDCILLDNMKSTYDVTKMFIAKGHGRIGLIVGDPLLSTTSERIQGYKSALRDSGMSVDESLIKTGSFSHGSGYELTRDAVKEGKATALFFASDLMTIGALAYLQEEKIRIPEDVCLISSNNFKWTEITKPSLSVVEQPSYEEGQKAAEVLLSRIASEGEGDVPFKEYRITTKIILRQSFAMDGS